MTIRNKIFIPNETYFITFTILGWRKIFVNKEVISLVYKWFDYVKTKYGNEVEGYVIMPNHLHVLVKITDRSPKLSVLIMNAKRFMAYEIVKYLENRVAVRGETAAEPNLRLFFFQIFQFFF